MKAEDRVIAERYVKDEDTGWVRLNSHVCYRKKNGVVSIELVSNTISFDDVFACVFPESLPEGLRPQRTVLAAIAAADKAGVIRIEPEGTIRIKFTTSPGQNWVNGFISFPV